MTTKNHMRAFLSVSALALVSSTWGCVADRPSRNAVFNENQYIRKDWLVRAGDDQKPDRGWFLKATITDASEPNVFGDGATYGLYPGSHSNGNIVHFAVTSDKLEMVNSREINSDPTVGRQAEVINGWPVTNVDLKYAINLDGEKTNQYTENQELDWQVRQWVKVNLDKNDMSDLAPLGDFFNENITKCSGSEASATLVPNSFLVDEKHDYMEWSVQITLPIKWGDADCAESFGAVGTAAMRIGREYETVTLKYSMVRAEQSPTYQPLMLDEKDPIRRKYGPITYINYNRDTDTGLLAAREYVIRFDPTQEIKWYWEKNFPNDKKNIFTRTNLPSGIAPLPAGQQTIEEATNALLQQANVAARVSFHEYNENLEDGTPIERSFGDIRFNMFRWIQSLDQQSTFAGVESGVIDPRNGRVISNDIVFANFAIKDYYVERIDAFLQSVGASANVNNDWPANPQQYDNSTPPKLVDVTCDATGAAAGLTAPIIDATTKINHNGNSTLFQKIQQYLYKPTGDYGPLGPQDFVKKQDDDFRQAYFALLPYIEYGDPAMNPFVTAEGGAGQRAGMNTAYWDMISQERQFHALASKIDHGQNVFEVTSPTGEKDALNFLNSYQQFSRNHRNLKYTQAAMNFTPGLGVSRAHTDKISDFSLISVMSKDARHCINDATNGAHWESKDEWINSLIQSYWSQVFWHEFGHAMGLEHNFMGSIDQPNFPPALDASGNQIKNSDGTNRYALYSNSVMEYNTAADRIFWTAGWGPYDRGAIAWIYANNGSTPPKDPNAAQVATTGISGQTSPKAPWNDPAGYSADGTKELAFLRCDERTQRYTPLCRSGDLGTTPSEIVANALDNYEWLYKYRNFRLYRKIWDDSKYADQPLEFVTELRRFISMWSFDLSSSELTANFTKIGIKPPQNAPSAQLYYAQLTDKFTDEMAHAGALSAAYHEAIIQQSSGQRPYVTVYDNFFGDVTQQGITLDKLDALQSFLALWPVEDYDPDQSAGLYVASYSPFGLSDNINGTAIGSQYQTIAEAAATSMIGGSYDAFSYFKPLGVAQFTQDTHRTEFLGAIAGAARFEVRDLTGGFLFTRPEDFLSYFRELAVQNNFANAQNGIDCTTTTAACNYDPRNPRAFAEETFYSDQYNEFLGPNGRRYIWVYVQDRNTWVVCDRDRNSATYAILRNYTTDVLVQKDDGNYGGPAFTDELEVKYFIDYFTAANGAYPLQ